MCPIFLPKYVVHGTEFEELIWHGAWFWDLNNFLPGSLCLSLGRSQQRCVLVGALNAARVHNCRLSPLLLLKWAAPLFKESFTPVHSSSSSSSLVISTPPPNFSGPQPIILIPHFLSLLLTFHSKIYLEPITWDLSISSSDNYRHPVTCPQMLPSLKIL